MAFQPEHAPYSNNEHVSKVKCSGNETKLDTHLKKKHGIDPHDKARSSFASWPDYILFKLNNCKEWRVSQAKPYKNPAFMHKKWRCRVPLVLFQIL